MVLILDAIYILFSIFGKNLVYLNLRMIFNHHDQLEGALLSLTNKKEGNVQGGKHVHPQFAFYVTKGGLEQAEIYRLYAMCRDFGNFLEICFCRH
jgi:hypothetical protein